MVISVMAVMPVGLRPLVRSKGLLRPTPNTNIISFFFIDIQFMRLWEYHMIFLPNANQPSKSEMKDSIVENSQSP